MRKTKKTLKDIVFDIYRELYSNSDPPASFDDLYENAIIDEQGRKNIDYLSYEIDDELMNEIIEKHCKDNKLKDKEKSAIKINVYLGCSPKSKRKIKTDE